jgi:D-beta-D-heptose 7-phosphate kinase/D-beta-D-heptose 1-phosphate adenosyltransferase
VNLFSASELQEYVARLRAEGRRIVFTNGVFDILHPGHLRYLQAARAHGDALVVGLNSDASVRRNKGPERPITPEHERAEILLALECVDAVSIFDEDTPHAIIARVQPDVLVKGADWPADQIDGRDILEAGGGVVVREALAPGYSTTAIVEKIRNSNTS